MQKFMVPACAALLCFAALAPAQDTAKDIIERAIKAHGGQDKLARITCDKVKANGVLFIGEADVPCSSETWVQLPDQFKNTVVLTQNDVQHKIVQILDGDKVSVTQDGQPVKVTAALEAEMHDNVHLERCVRLVPLLTDKAFELTALDETKVNDQPASCVKVAMKGRKDVKMFFDKETHLLVKTEHIHDDAKGGTEVKQEEYYGKFKDLGGGFNRPTEINIYRDGKKVFKAQLLEVSYHEKIPEAEFGKK